MNAGDHMHGMATPPSNGTTMMHPRHMMMHMTFFWGKNAEILFDGWPGYNNLGMYILALAVVFFLTVIVEWLSHCKFLRETAAPAAGVAQTVLYMVRIGLVYLVMLALMSFNVGVFLVAILGHGIGFFFFGSRAFNKQTAVTAVSGKSSDLPRLNCC